MTSNPPKLCVVCAKAATQRCSECVKAVFSLYVCSKEHQKLIWPFHKHLCGPGKAIPFKHPALADHELDILMSHLDASFWSNLHYQPPTSFRVTAKTRTEVERKLSTLDIAEHDKVMRLVRCALQLAACDVRNKDKGFSNVEPLWFAAFVQCYYKCFAPEATSDAESHLTQWALLTSAATLLLRPQRGAEEKLDDYLKSARVQAHLEETFSRFDAFGSYLLDNLHFPKMAVCIQHLLSFTSFVKHACSGQGIRADYTYHEGTGFTHEFRLARYRRGDVLALGNPKDEAYVPGCIPLD
ncbi:hypothetical protein JCM10908_000079 [Rhodotorula pacifica]|uniref:zinc finger MYND domain-containing protein n=1 Tax=Rhodotorula pacifica TaxID=1495444 RepID=UPI00317783DE